jgi:hypothetical protein
MEYPANGYQVPQTFGSMAAESMSNAASTGVYNPAAVRPVDAGNRGEAGRRFIDWLGGQASDIADSGPMDILNAPQRLNPFRLLGFAHGGATTEEHIRVGEPAVAGQPNPERILNPTGAPLIVVPESQASMGQPDAEYAEGTGALEGLDYNDPGSVFDFMKETGARSLEDTNTGNTYSYSGGNSLSRANGGYMSSANPLTAPKTYDFSQRNSLGFADMLGGQFPDSPMVTQAELIADAERALPPAVRDTLAGVAPRPLQSLGFRPLSMRQLSRLTPEEGAALGSYTRLKYNASPEFVGQQTERLFGMPRGQMQQAVVRGQGL